MLLRLLVTNYQSIASAELELGPFTVIVGENGAGKSAILRALGALCFNETGSDFIRKGAKGVSVTVEVADGDPKLTGQQVTWEKDARGGARYILRDAVDIHDREFNRLGSSVPADITQALGIRRLDIDATTRLAPQFHEQGDYGFLLRESSGKAARVLAKLTKLDVIVTAQVECRRDAQRAKGDADEATATISRVETQIASIPDVAGAKAYLESAEAGAGEAHQLVTAIDESLTLDGDRREAARLAGVTVPSDVLLGAVGDGLSIVQQAQRHLQSLRHAEGIAGVRLPKDSALRQIGEAVDRCEAMGRTFMNHQSALARQLTSARALDDASQAFAGVQKEWDAVVAELELCDHCPLRQGVDGCGCSEDES